MVKNEDLKRTQLRMPSELYDRIVTLAKNNHVSMNFAIIEILSQSLNNDNEFLFKKEKSKNSLSRSQIRLPLDLHKRLVTLAKNNRISMNSAIIEILSQSLNNDNEFFFKKEKSNSSLSRSQIRLPSELHEQIVRFAKKNELSMNSALIKLLKKSLDDE